MMEAQVLTWAGRYLRALVQWDSVIAMFPDRLDGLTGKAKTLAWAGELPAADSLYSVVLRRDPTNADALDGRAQAAFWQGRNADAIAGYERALSYRPDDITARTGLAQVYLASGRQLDAMGAADSAVAISPTNRDAQRARQDIARAVLGEVDISLGWSDDSDQNTMWWQVVSVAAPVSNRVRGFASVGAYEGSSTPNLQAQRGTAEVGATFLKAQWQLTVAGGLQGLWPETNPSRNVLTGRLAAGYRIQPSLGVGVSYAHFPYAETAYLIGADLDIDAVDASVEATLGHDLTLSAGGGAGWFSDGNVRTSGVLAVTKQLPNHFFAGGLGRMVWFQEPGVGYFSPNRFTVLEGRGGYARISPTWETRVSGGAGVQQTGFGGGWQFEGHVEGRAAYWFADRNRIEAFAGVSNSAYLSATGAYRWGTAGVVLRIGI